MESPVTVDGLRGRLLLPAMCPGYSKLQCWGGNLLVRYEALQTKSSDSHSDTSIHTETDQTMRFIIVIMQFWVGMATNSRAST
jgi:hypothetical protein